MILFCATTLKKDILSAINKKVTAKPIWGRIQLNDLNLGHMGGGITSELFVNFTLRDGKTSYTYSLKTRKISDMYAQELWVIDNGKPTQMFIQTSDNRHSLDELCKAAVECGKELDVITTLNFNKPQCFERVYSYQGNPVFLSRDAAKIHMNARYGAKAEAEKTTELWGVGPVSGGPVLIMRRSGIASFDELCELAARDSHINVKYVCGTYMYYKYPVFDSSEKVKAHLEIMNDLTKRISLANKACSPNVAHAVDALIHNGHNTVVSIGGKVINSYGDIPSEMLFGDATKHKTRGLLTNKPIIATCKFELTKEQEEAFKKLSDSIKAYSDGIAASARHIKVDPICGFPNGWLGLWPKVKPEPIGTIVGVDEGKGDDAGIVVTVKKNRNHPFFKKASKVSEMGCFEQVAKLVGKGQAQVELYKVITTEGTEIDFSIDDFALAFKWHKTPQGFNYWNDLYENIRLG